MSNMSYCRFEKDCKVQLELLFARSGEADPISKGNNREREARIALIELAQEIAEMIEDERTGGREGLTVEDLVKDAEEDCEEVPHRTFCSVCLAGGRAELMRLSKLGVCDHGGGPSPETRKQSSN